VIPLGMCQCGCGQNTKLAKYSSARDGCVKGEPMRYIHGHNRQTKTPNPIRLGFIDGEQVAFVQFKDGRESIIDVDSIPYVAPYRWFISPKGYVCRMARRKCLFLHKELPGAVPSLKRDHIKGNTLDNRLAMLRPCRQSQNGKNRAKSKSNTTGFKGVHRDKRNGNFVAHIKVDRKGIFLGTRSTAEEAARLYDRGAIKYHGEYARLNFPLDCRDPRHVGQQSLPMEKDGE
jgi:hypothetical protein